MDRKTDLRLWAVLFWLAVWQIAAMALAAVYPHGELLLASPADVLLRLGQQLHKAGQRPGGHFCHKNTPFRVILLSFSAETGRYRIVKTAKKRSRPIALGRELTLRGATQIRGRLPPLAFWYGKGTVDVSVPAPPLSFLRGRRDAFSIAPLSVRLRSGLLLRRHSGVFI